MTEPLVRICNLSVSASDGPLITHPTSLHIEKGEAIRIVGESGSGKSLMARALAGLVPKGLSASGQVYLERTDILNTSKLSKRNIRGNRISLLFQDPFTMLKPLLRSSTHIEEGLHRHKPGESGRECRQEAQRRLCEFGIDDPAIGRRFPFDLSGGLRQRIGISAALSGVPDLLIADEPTTALDVTTQAEVIALLKRTQVQRDLSLMLITQICGWRSRPATGSLFYTQARCWRKEKQQISWPLRHTPILWACSCPSRQFMNV